MTNPQDILDDYKKIFQLSTSADRRKARTDFIDKYNPLFMTQTNAVEMMSGVEHIDDPIPPKFKISHSFNKRAKVMSFNIGNGKKMILPNFAHKVGDFSDSTRLFTNEGNFSSPTIIQNDDYAHPLIKGRGTNKISDVTMPPGWNQTDTASAKAMQRPSTNSSQQQVDTSVASQKPTQNPSGLPSKEVRQEVPEGGMQIFQTDEDGKIKLDDNGSPSFTKEYEETYIDPRRKILAARGKNEKTIDAVINEKRRILYNGIVDPKSGASNILTKGQVSLDKKDIKKELSEISQKKPNATATQDGASTAETPPQQQAGNGKAVGAATKQAGTAQPTGGTSASEPSAYAKAIKEENDRYTKETAGFDEKRKSLLRADGDQTEALKGLETERAVAVRQHGINRIQNAMDAMQGTEAFGKLYETEHLQSSGITKTGFPTSGMHYASLTEEERNGFLKSASKELGLTAEETKELKTASSSISQAYKNIWKQQAEIKSRYGESMKLVNSKDGLANMTNEQKIKHLGLSSRHVERLNKNIPLTVQETMTDKLKSAWYSLTGGTAYGSKYHDLHRDIFKRAATKREQQIGQALDKMIMGRAQAGEWASKQTADRLAAIKRGDAAAIYDAAHAYDGPNANKTGALLREAPAAKAAAKKAAAETGGGSGIKWKGKVGAAAALLGLGAVFGTMMGHHGEQSNAQLYNPNPQPQYAN